MYNYPVYQKYPNYIYHHGIKGQKWGIRRYQNEDGTLTAAGKKRQFRKDNKQRRKFKRQTAAARRNVARKAYDTISANQKYEDAKREYTSANSAFAITSKGRKAKNERIAEARRNLDEASRSVAEARAGFKRANRFYDENAKALQDQVNKMIKEYGPDKVKQLKTKNVRYGNDYVRTVLRTGITLADIPVIGDSYIGSVVSKYENRIRDERVDLDTDYRDRYGY